MKKFIAATLLAMTIMSATYAQNPDPKQPRVINVNGTAELEIIPDEIFVQVQLQEYKKGNTKVDIEKLKKDFIKAVISIGIPDTNISVQGFSGYDENNWWIRKNKKKNPDMMAGITYWVKLGSTRKMDELVEKLDDEATQNFFIAKVSHSRVQEIKKQLKIEAVKAAKEKATYLAGAIGERVGNAININEPHEIGYYPPMMRNSNMAMKEVSAQSGDAASTPNIDFKKIKYQFEVSVTFALN